MITINSLITLEWSHCAWTKHIRGNAQPVYLMQSFTSKRTIYIKTGKTENHILRGHRAQNFSLQTEHSVTSNNQSLNIPSLNYVHFRVRFLPISTNWCHNIFYPLFVHGILKLILLQNLKKLQCLLAVSYNKGFLQNMQCLLNKRCYRQLKIRATLLDFAYLLFSSINIAINKP